MSNTQLVPKQNNQPSEWQIMKEQAQVMIRSGFLPSSINTPEKCMAIAMTGKELGIGFMESIRSINVIAGKPTISPQLMLALANRTGELENIDIDATDDRCKVTVKRKGRSAHTNEFGIKEATELQLMGKENYKKQKKTMFQWRALAANLRVTFPDVVLGLYTPEELGAEVHVNEQEQMEVVEVKPAPQPKVEPRADLITVVEQAHLISECKTRLITETDLKDFLYKELGAKKRSDIRSVDLPKVMEWIIRNDKRTVAEQH